MTNAFLFLIGNLVSLACVTGAWWLASQGIDGWGWFLFVAVLTVSEFKPRDRNDSRD